MSVERYVPETLSYTRSKNGAARIRRGLPVAAVALVFVSVAVVSAYGLAGPSNGDAPHDYPAVIHKSIDAPAFLPELGQTAADGSAAPAELSSTSSPAPGPPPSESGAGRATAAVLPTTPSRLVPSFSPMRIEAEAPSSRISGGATIVECGPCSGGARVGYIAGPAQVIIVANLPTPGARTIRVVYETDGPRQLKIKINDVYINAYWLPGTGWEVPNSFQFTTTLTAGLLELTFYNDTLPAPDIDSVVIS
jgi:hypothetical protein